MVLEIIIIKFSCNLKMMSRNTFPELQPDSAFNVLSFLEIEMIYTQDKKKKVCPL